MLTAFDVMVQRQSQRAPVRSPVMSSVNQMLTAFDVIMRRQRQRAPVISLWRHQSINHPLDCFPKWSHLQSLRSEKEITLSCSRGRWYPTQASHTIGQSHVYLFTLKSGENIKHRMLWLISLCKGGSSQLIIDINVVYLRFYALNIWLQTINFCKLLLRQANSPYCHLDQSHYIFMSRALEAAIFKRGHGKEKVGKMSLCVLCEFSPI